MSLIGSLEDLGLGDILQIINLSQKSGVLSIRGDVGEGRICFEDGMVRTANLKGGPEDLHGLLVERGLVSDVDFAAARKHSEANDLTIEESLSCCASITRERIDSLRRESVEAVVAQMFSWTTGDFSFDVGGVEEWGTGELALSTGVNAQYLAMESLRVRDEDERNEGGEGGADPTQSDLNLDLPAHEMFGVADGAGEDAAVPDPLAGFARPPEDSLLAAVELDDQDRAIDTLVSAAAERGSPDLEAPGPGPELRSRDEDMPVAVIAEQPAAPSSQTESPASSVPPATSGTPTTPARNLPPLVVIDPQLWVLEWVRAALAPQFSTIHIFQRSKDGLGRIRQYLARAEMPALLVSPGIEGDPLGGIPDACDFVRRLEKQAPRMVISWLGDSAQVETLSDADPRPRLLRPDTPEAARATESQLNRAQAQELREGLYTRLESPGDRSAPRSPSARVPDESAPGEPAQASPNGSSSLDHLSSEGLERLKAATQSLSDASTRGDVLPLVIRFAAEFFDRVAMFAVRGDCVTGIAQLGFDICGGPDDVEMRALRIGSDESSWFRRVIEQRSALRGPIGNEGDRKLLDLLGVPDPVEAYVAPITSADHVVALLYADCAAGASVSSGDATALEVVLHHAGLALDRAALERALAQIEDESG